MNINLLAFMDAARFTASYHGKLYKETTEVSPGVRVLDLDPLALAQWPTGEAFIGRVEQFLATLPGMADYELTSPKIVDMDPGSFIPWQQDQPTVLFMCMTRSPGLKILAGAEMAAPLPFDLLLVNQREICCVANPGQFPAVFLYANISYRSAGAA